MQSHLILAMLWLVYVVLHSVLASLWFKSIMRSFMGKAFVLYRLYYSLFAFAGLIFLVVYMMKMEQTAIFYSPIWLQIIGGIFMTTGLILMMACIRKYFFSLSGLKFLMTEEHHDQLMIKGIHRYVRHPLYLGTFAFLWGGFLLLPVASILITNFIITIYTLIGMKLEERKLLMQFGSAYENYRNKVPALLPWRRKSGRLQGSADTIKGFND